MDNLSISTANYVKAAREHFSKGDYSAARQNLLHACECTLLLAKKSSGEEREKHLSTFKSLKQFLYSVDERIAAVSKKSSIASSPSLSAESPSEKPQGNNMYNDTAPSAPPQFVGSLSPRRLTDYIGQPQAVTAVKELIDAALLRGSALPHIILYGSHGLGKTTFAKIIANEMGANFIEVNVSNINAQGMVTIFKQLKARDILFIDEIHTMPLQVAESVMYSAMQDGRITYTEGKGSTARTETLDLPPFTLIGATTEIGKLAKPFIQRAIQVRLEEYSDEVLAEIIKSSFYKLGMKADDDISLKISHRCRSNPRIANNTVKRISDKALVRYASLNNIRDRGVFGSVEEIRKLDIPITEGIVDEFFNENGIDEFGLEKADRELLRIMITRYGGGPVGIDTLARAINESNNVISEKYEAFLIKKGMLKIEREGRVVMPEGYRAMRLPVPEGLSEKLSSEEKKSTSQNSEKYEKKKISASKHQDAFKCERIERLIVYPESVKIDTTPLDLLFPDVERPLEEMSKHPCELEIDFGDKKRLIICDSFLESRFASALAGVGYIQDMKAQSLEIPYISQQLATRRYFPDFVIRDYKGRIAIIEMKNFETACYHLNIDKYEKLAEYCESNGYGYAEIMKDYNAEEYTSIDAISKRPINRRLEEFIFEAIESNGKVGEAAFGLKDLDVFNEKHGKAEKADIYAILLNNRRLKNIDRGGTNLKIILN